MTVAPARVFAETFVDELARCGLQHVCIAPGSRSAPLALAFARHPDVRAHVHLDERSAAFMALGIAASTGTPVALVCTSGTAPAHFLPAIAEADLSDVPLIVLTADRPPELRDTGANQTLDQIKMFGEKVRWFAELGVPEGQLGADPDRYWRSVAARAIGESIGSPPGPVHLNVALREPLVDSEEGSAALPGRPDRKPWVDLKRAPRTMSERDMDGLVGELAEKRGAIVAGPGCDAPSHIAALAEELGWPLLADPLSNARQGTAAIGAYDAILRSDRWVQAHRPEVVLRLGSTGISKPLLRNLSGIHQIVIDPHGRMRDPDRSIGRMVVADGSLLLPQLRERVSGKGDGWLESWRTADRVAQAAIDEALGNTLSEPQVARELVATLPDGSELVVGASMPFRDVESFSRPRQGVSFSGNRGANGIDGFISTTVGTAIGSGRPTWGLCGDLTLLHDTNGALGLEHRSVEVTFVVLNNDGGGIFSFLPQAASPDHFETLFGTPHGRDLSQWASFHGIDHRLVENATELKAAITGGGTKMVEIRTDRAANRALHRDVNEAIIAAVESAL